MTGLVVVILAAAVPEQIHSGVIVVAVIRIDHRASLVYTVLLILSHISTTPAASAGCRENNSGEEDCSDLTDTHFLLLRSSVSMLFCNSLIKKRVSLIFISIKGKV